MAMQEASRLLKRYLRDRKVQAAGVGLVILLVIGLGKDKGPSGAEFLAGREVTALGGLDQGVVLGGSCVSKYRIQMIGISDGRRHFLATIDLKDNPRTRGELFTLLAGKDCEEEMARALSQMGEAFPADLKQDSDVLLFSYRTKQGKRFLP